MLNDDQPIETSEAEARPYAGAEPENIRAGDPYDDAAFEQLAREHGVWGRSDSALCAVFWRAGKAQRPSVPNADLELGWGLDDKLYVLLQDPQAALERFGLEWVMEIVHGLHQRAYPPNLSAPPLTYTILDGTVSAAHFDWVVQAMTLVSSLVVCMQAKWSHREDVACRRLVDHLCSQQPAADASSIHPASTAQQPSGQSAADQIAEAPRPLPGIYRNVREAYAAGFEDARLTALSILRAQPAAATVPAEFVPGLWRCAKCNFELIQSNLNANTGAVTARDQAGDRCPNCDAPLWRVTWKQHAEALAKIAEDMFERSRAARDEALEEAAQVCDGVSYAAVPHRASVAREIARNIRLGLKAEPAVQAAPAVPLLPVEPAVTLSGAQLLEALDFIAPDRATDVEQLECEVSIQWGDGHSGKGYYCWCCDCPDEGAILLDGTTAAPAPPAVDAVPANDQQAGSPQGGAE